MASDQCAQNWSDETTSPPSRREDRAEGDQVDRVLDEPDRAVAEQGVDAAGVEGERLLVLARPGCRRSRWSWARALPRSSACPCCWAGRRSRRRCPDRPIARTGAAPSGPPAGPLPADDRVLPLEELADEPLVAAGALDDRDRVARAVGDLADRASCRPSAGPWPPAILLR